MAQSSSRAPSPCARCCDAGVKLTEQMQTAGTPRGRVVLAILIVAFGVPAAAFSFAALFLVCGIGTCPADGHLNGFSYMGLVIALAAATLLGVPFLIPPWARKKTRLVTAAVIAGVLFLALAIVIAFPQSLIGN